MRNTLKILVFLPAILLSGGNDSYCQDPDSPDSIIIENVSAAIGDTIAVVPIFAVTDDQVAFFNTPLTISAPAGGFSVRTVSVVPGHLSQWDDVFYDFLDNEQYLRLFGIWDTGGDDNPALNTENQRSHILDLVLNIEPGAPDQYVAIGSAVDSVGGAILLGLIDGVTGFPPAFKPGLITYGNPSPVNDEVLGTPLVFALRQNYPNPFNPRTSIQFELATQSTISLEIYNLLGQHVRTLSDGFFEPGVHTIVWDSKDDNGIEIPSGIYFYVLSAGDNLATGKMLLLR